MRQAIVILGLLLASCAHSEPNPFAERWYFAGPPVSLAEFDAVLHGCWAQAQHAYFTTPRYPIPGQTPQAAYRGYYNSPGYAQAGASLSAAISNLGTRSETGMTLAQGAAMVESCIRTQGFQRISADQVQDALHEQLGVFAQDWGEAGRIR